jgi:hypothetical protein
MTKMANTALGVVVARAIAAANVTALAVQDQEDMVVNAIVAALAVAAL